LPKFQLSRRKLAWLRCPNPSLMSRWVSWLPTYKYLQYVVPQRDKTRRTRGLKAPTFCFPCMDPGTTHGNGYKIESLRWSHPAPPDGSSGMRCWVAISFGGCSVACSLWCVSNAYYLTEY
jgi:hypothetical protein